MFAVLATIKIYKARLNPKPNRVNGVIYKDCRECEFAATKYIKTLQYNPLLKGPAHARERDAEYRSDDYIILIHDNVSCAYSNKELR